METGRTRWDGRMVKIPVELNAKAVGLGLEREVEAR